MVACRRLDDPDRRIHRGQRHAGAELRHAPGEEAFLRLIEREARYG
jgi:hypothetical protein